MRRVIWVMALAAALGAAAQAQNYTAVTASNIVDATGAKVASGQLCFTATDLTGKAIAFEVGGGGQAISGPVCWTVTNGAIAAGAQVANPAVTSPEGILYHIIATDSSGQVVLDYPLVSFAGASFDLDDYFPGGPISVVATLPLGITLGGTGTANPAVTAGAGISITGAWPDLTVSCTGCGAGDVTSVFGRTGAVVGTSGDYSFSEISGTPTAAQIAGAGTLNNSTSGNAATATALAAAPTQCPGTEIVTGVGANGDANCQDPLVSGPTPNGAAPTSGSNPVLTGGWDGTDVRTFSTDAAGRLSVNVNGTVPVSVGSLPALPSGSNTVGAVDQAGTWTVGVAGNPQVQIQEDATVVGTAADDTADSTAKMPTIPAVATTTAPSYTSGDMVPLSTDLGGNLRVSCANCGGGSGGTGMGDAGAFTEGTTSFTPVGGEYNSSPAALTSGHAGTVLLTSTRHLETSISDPLPAGSNTIGSVTGSGTFTVAGTVTASSGAGFPIAPTASAAVNDSASGLTQIVAAVSGKAIYVTGYTVVANAAVSVQWEYGTGTACATGTTALTGPMSFAANGGAAPRETLFVPAGDALCLNLGASVQVGGSVSYAQQ